MGFHLAGYLAVVAVITATPGPDTVVVVRNTLRHGRRSGLFTAVGSASGLWCWGLAAGLGVAGVLAASATAFTVLKLAGAAYLLSTSASGASATPVAARSGTRTGSGVPHSGSSPRRGKAS